MSNYTSIFIYPVDERFQPSKLTLYKILEFFMVDRINIARGSNSGNDNEGEEGEESVFFLRNVTLNEVIYQINKHHPSNTVMIFGSGEHLNNFCKSLINSIPVELMNDFVPWDTGMTIGRWKARDYETDDVVAEGSFSIQKSGNGCPINLLAYLGAFNENPEVKKLLKFLELETNCKWTTCIQLS